MGQRKRLAKLSKADRNLGATNALMVQVSQLKAMVVMLAERDQLRSRDPRKYSPVQIAEFVKELDGRHADLLEGWAKLCEDDAERLEAILGGPEAAPEEASPQLELPFEDRVPSGWAPPGPEDFGGTDAESLYILPTRKESP